MRWSKVRQLVEETFADSVRDRVTVRTTTYRRSTFGADTGRGWIMVDGKDVADFDDYDSARLMGEVHYPDNIGIAGHYGRWFRQSCWTYLNSSLNDSLRSSNPVLRSLSLLNGKVGRTRLARFAHAEEHPLPKALARFRIEAEKVLSRDRATHAT